MKEIIKKIDRQRIGSVIDALMRAREGGNTIYIMGNGGSASTATHFTCDLSKVTIVGDKKRFKVMCLNDNIPLVSALTNDDGWSEIYIEQLKSHFKEGDVAIAFSVHGGSGSAKAGTWSQNLLKALQYAKDRGGTAIGFSGFDGGVMRELADICVVVPFDSTPHVESFHLVLEHLITFCIRQKIEREGV
ncbi:TPA: SIS domain-containing protein [Candidatus Woesearchaeota archaeon]|nr:SIS domain-containing protein [Candidatus Woesearchaeota archaeon]